MVAVEPVTFVRFALRDAARIAEDSRRGLRETVECVSWTRYGVGTGVHQSLDLPRNQRPRMRSGRHVTMTCPVMVKPLVVSATTRLLITGPNCEVGS